MKLFMGGSYGLVLNDDSFWKSQRRFALHVLRDFGFGKPVLEDATIDQVNELINYINDKNGEPFNITFPLIVSFLSSSISLRDHNYLHL